MRAENLRQPKGAYGDAFRVKSAKKPKLIPKNLVFLEAEAQAVRVLEKAGRK